MKKSFALKCRFVRACSPLFVSVIWLGVASQARAIIAVSECSARDVVRVLRLPPERVHVITNAIDASFQRVETGGFSFGASQEREDRLAFVNVFAGNRDVRPRRQIVQ